MQVSWQDRGWVLFPALQWLQERLGEATCPGLHTSTLVKWREIYSPAGFEAKIRFSKLWSERCWEKPQELFSKLQSKTSVQRKGGSQISGQTNHYPNARTAKGRSGEQKAHARYFVPVIKHLLEQAESKCTADKENITMSQKTDSFWYFSQ